MAGKNAWKQKIVKPDIASSPKRLEQTLKRQIAWASGTEYFKDRDPLYHISESFRQTFAMLGMRAAGASLYETHMDEGKGMLSGADRDEAPQEREFGSEALSEYEREIAKTRFLEKTSMDGVFAPNPGRRDSFLGRFSETAFSRGNLAGAVMRGTGQMMLVSSLKRTIGQSQPKNFKQRKLFEGASAKRNVKGFPPDKAIFNKGDSDSAIALVVDVLRDSRRVVESLSSLLENGFEGNPGGSGTLQKLYPFLSVSREKALMEQYNEMLRGLSAEDSASSRQVLQRAATKLNALIAKKRQMRFQFMHHLRLLSNQAKAALIVFEQEGFREAVYDAVVGAVPPPWPEGDDREPEETPEKEDE